jgi:hypothetical protein
MVGYPDVDFGGVNNGVLAQAVHHYVDVAVTDGSAKSAHLQILS